MEHRPGIIDPLIRIRRKADRGPNIGMMPVPWASLKPPEALHPLPESPSRSPRLVPITEATPLLGSGPPPDPP